MPPDHLIPSITTDTAAGPLSACGATCVPPSNNCIGCGPYALPSGRHATNLPKKHARHLEASQQRIIASWELLRRLSRVDGPGHWRGRRHVSAALAAYARQRDDADLEVWTQEIRLRASIRIGGALSP